jgi:hypothetical protein
MGRIVRFGFTVKSVNFDLKVATQVLLFSTTPKPESPKNPVARGEPKGHAAQPGAYLPPYCRTHPIQC